MPDFYRVRDTNTGHEYNSPFLADGLEQVTDGDGNPAATHDVYGNPIAAVVAEPKSVDELTVPELKAKAEAQGVDLSGATKKADIAAKISKAEEAAK